MTFYKYLLQLHFTLLDAEYDNALTLEERNTLAGIRLTLLDIVWNKPSTVYGNKPEHI